MSGQSAEKDAEWARVLREHTRLTAFDKPFTCSCEPHVSDATQSWTDHMVAVYARVIAPGDRCVCPSTEVANGTCVLCGKPFLVGGGV